jgi:serine protease Do
MTIRLIAGIAVLLVSSTAAIAQPAPGEPVPPPGPPPAPSAFSDQPRPLPGADPIWGTVALANDFLPDPQRVELTAGGPVDASRLGGECGGWISEAPSYSILYSPQTVGQWPLIFSAISDRADLVLAVREPLGPWHCNDDTEGTNPLVRIENPIYGIYTIWVGTYERSPEQPATLFISEVVAGWEGVQYGAEGPNLDLAEQEMRLRDMYGEIGGRVDLRTGFLPDPYTATVTAGGTRAAPDGCPGFIDGPPDYLVAFTAGANPLLFTAYSATDTTLIVQGPDLRFSCNDDTFGHDPLVRYEAPVTGVYAIWVGTYAAGPEVPGVRLEVSERPNLR